MTLCLTRAEIKELTNASTYRKQVAFLRANGIRHYVDPANGRPSVTRAAVEGERDQVQDKVWKPNKAA